MPNRGFKPHRSAVYFLRESDGEPPRWLVVGWLPDGRDVELVAVGLSTGWLVIHAKSPVEKKFRQEIERTERRSR